MTGKIGKDRLQIENLPEPQKYAKYLPFGLFLEC